MGDRVCLVVGGVAGLPLEGSSRLVQGLPQQVIMMVGRWLVALLFFTEFQSVLIHSFRLALSFCLSALNVAPLFSGRRSFSSLLFGDLGLMGIMGKAPRSFPHSPMIFLSRGIM